MTKATPRLFVSHADADKPVVELLVKLLKHGLKIPSNRIYCTALRDTGIVGGVQFVKSVFDRLADPATIVLVLLSRNFYDSAFSLNEVGAAWIQKKKLLLYTIPPFDHTSLKGVVFDRQANSLTKRANLEELRSELPKALSSASHNNSDWNAAVQCFLAALGPAAYEIERRRAGIEYDLFVSTPMSSVTPQDYNRIRQMALDLVATVKKSAAAAGISDFRAYYAATSYRTKKAFDAKTMAVKKDLSALRASENYMLIYDRAAPTSAIFEAGMALAYTEVSDNYAFERSSTYFHRKQVELPFMMQELPAKFKRVRKFRYTSEKALQDTAETYPLPFKRWDAWNIDEV